MVFSRSRADLGPASSRRRFDPVAVLVTLGIFAWLLFAIASGLPGYHEHPAPPRTTRETFHRGGVVVYLADYLGDLGAPSIRSGALWGAGFFADYEELPLRPRVIPDSDGGAVVELSEPDGNERGPRIRFSFTPEGFRGVQLAAREGDEHPRDLTGTIAIDTLDWTAPGVHRCSFALHSEEGGGRCYRGWFEVER